MRTIERNALAIENADDLQVIEFNGDRGACGRPSGALGDRDDDGTRADPCQQTVGTVISNRNGAGIIDGIEGNDGVTDGSLYGIVISARYGYTIPKGRSPAGARYGRLADHRRVHVIEGRIGLRRNAGLIIGLRLEVLVRGAAIALFTSGKQQAGERGDKHKTLEIPCFHKLDLEGFLVFIQASGRTVGESFSLNGE